MYDYLDQAIHDYDSITAFDYHALMTDGVPFSKDYQQKLFSFNLAENTKTIIIGNPRMQGFKDSATILGKFGLPFIPVSSYPFRAKKDKYNEDGSIFMLVQPLQFRKAIQQGLRINQQDIVLIVSGGGDFTQTNSFKYNSYWTKTFLAALTSHCTTILGIGHSTDTFSIDAYVTHCAITPTDAAYYAVELTRRKHNDLLLR
jgi:hypothetical protein